MGTKTADDIYYVLPPGATQEEQWPRESLAAMCRSGQLSPDTRIFVPERNEWVRAGDSGLGLEFRQTDGGGESGRQSLLEDYEHARSEISRDPGAADNYVTAGRLAVQLEDRNAARDLFQTALNLQPFNARIAREIRRNFSKAECEEFVCLHRDPPVWEIPAELLTYPLSAGAAYSGIVAAAVFVFALVPYGGYVGLPVVFLWCLQVARSVARGDNRLPLWNRALDNPVREIVLPLAAGLAVTGEFTVVFWGVGRLLAGGNGGGAFGYIANSPVLSVILPLAGLVYLPAVFVRITYSVGIIADLLNPWTAVRAMTRMGQEYAVSVLVLLPAVSVIAGVEFVAGAVPVLGPLALALASAYLLPIVSFVLGRLAGRMRHLL